MSIPPSTITFSPNPVAQGQNTRMYAQGFTPGGNVYYLWLSIKFQQLLQANSKGEIDVLITIDSNRTPADYAVELLDETSGRQVNGTLTVIPASIPTPVIGAGITPVTISGAPPVIPPPVPQQPPPVTTNPILAPIQNLIQQVEQDIKSFIQGIISGIDWIINVVTPVTQYIDTRLGQTEQAISEDIASIPTTIESTIASATETLKIDITNELNNLSTAVEQTSSALTASLTTDVINPTLNIIQNLPAEVENAVAKEVNSLEESVSQIESIVQQDLQTFNNDIINQVQQVDARVQQAWANLGSTTEGLYTEFNAFNSTVEGGFSSFATGIENLPSELANALIQIAQGVTAPALNQIQKYFQDAVNGIKEEVTTLLLAKISDDPTLALEQIISRVTALGLTIAGTIAVLKILENLNPLSNLQLEEGFKHILEFVGVYDLSRETLKLFVDNGIGLQAEYALNWQFQAKKVEPAQSAKSIWYGERGMTEYQRDLRFEGYEDDAIKAYSATVYRPMSAFILEKLIEFQMVPNDFSMQQLIKEGLSPDDANVVFQAFNNLALQGFQGTIRTLIYTMFKDGFIDVAKATLMMDAFSIPANQQQWILNTATMEYGYETQVLYSIQIIDA
ncbi:MAG: hypothetical protein KGI08_07305, partial [Thaumarchaeota archaeon]|nr:hypothetical protein [Nitrososphaerota archaeon]